MVGWGGAYPLELGRVVEPDDQPQISRVLTFKLGADGALPDLEWEAPEMPEPPEESFDAALVSKGRDVYHNFCQYCHGDNAIGGGLVPDLRYSAVLHDAEMWDEVTLDGIFAEAGMAAFKDYIDGDQSQAVRAYVIDEAQKTKGATAAD